MISLMGDGFFFGSARFGGKGGSLCWKRGKSRRVEMVASIGMGLHFHRREGDDGEHVIGLVSP